MNRESKRALWVVLVLVGLIVAGVIGFGGKEPPAGVTSARMAALADGVRAFAAAEGRMPVGLDEVVAGGYYEGELVDGWGKALRFEVLDGRLARLVSYGADDKEGGMMFKRDREVEIVID